PGHLEFRHCSRRIQHLVPPRYSLMFLRSYPSRCCLSPNGHKHLERLEFPHRCSCRWDRYILGHLVLDQSSSRHRRQEQRLDLHLKLSQKLTRSSTPERQLAQMVPGQVQACGYHLHSTSGRPSSAQSCALPCPAES